jgi:hypothetical protein
VLARERCPANVPWRGRRLDRHREDVATYRGRVRRPRAGRFPASPFSRPASACLAAGTEGRRPGSRGWGRERSAELADRLAGFANLPPFHVAKDLGRSAGAVGNALTTLADRAEAARLAGKPIRYEANAATAAAAAAIAPKAPAPPAAPGPVTHPGGQVYQPRVLAGMADVEALRTLRAEGVPALLAGPARARRAWSRRPSPT